MHTQIAPPSEEAFIVREADQLTFDLSMMKSLRVLFVDSISEHQFQGRHQLPGQLEAIEVRRTVNSLKVCEHVQFVQSRLSGVRFVGG